MFPRGKKRETRNFRKQFTTYLRTWFIRVPTLRHFPYYILLICISPFEWTKLPIAYYVILFFCNMTYIIKKHTRYNFSSNHNIHWRLWDLGFWAPDPLIDRFYKNLLIKGSGEQKQRPHKLLWMLWFDEKVHLISVVQKHTVVMIWKLFSGSIQQVVNWPDFG